jgi:hypothetical protein
MRERAPFFGGQNLVEPAPPKRPFEVALDVSGLAPDESIRIALGSTKLDPLIGSPESSRNVWDRAVEEASMQFEQERSHLGV